ncbi:MAG: VWA domain-containing protein [Acidobacteriota bacterium]|nr:VWA domain-containing protein [Blastocatellia bacterium]MDW8411665.1 VWA domain-containing protein [Acidobacteriota bacterium]
MLALLFLLFLQDPPEETIHISTDLVLINATVTDLSGRFVPNLRRQDFILRADGERKEIAHFANEEAPFAAAILIDTSASMNTRLRRAYLAAINFAENLRADDVIAVYAFNTQITLLTDFVPGHKLIPDWQMRAYGVTRLYDCLYEAIEKLSTRKELRRAVVLISDGEDTRSIRSSESVLKLALQKGVVIYAIDIAENSNSPRLEQLRSQAILKEFAEKTGGRYVRSAGGHLLANSLAEIAQELRSQYTLGFYPDKRDVKWHTLTLEVIEHNGPLKVRARQGY